MNDIDELIAAIPPPKVRRRASRTPEIEASILGLARRGVPLTFVGGLTGIPSKTVQIWARGPSEFAMRLRAAIEEGREFEREVARLRFMARAAAGERRLRGLVPKRVV